MNIKTPPSQLSTSLYFPNPTLQGWPLSFRFHTYFLLCFGLQSILFPSFTTTPPSWAQGCLSALGLPTGANASPQLTPQELSHKTNIGLLIFAIGTAYLLAFREIDEGSLKVARALTNGRLVTAMVTALLMVVDAGSRDAFKMGIVVEDGILGAVTAWELANWTV